jgi:hypothetical protein
LTFNEYHNTFLGLAKIKLILEIANSLKIIYFKSGNLRKLQRRENKKIGGNLRASC